MRDERLWMYKTISVQKRVRPGYSTIGFAWLAAFAVIFVAILFNRNNALASNGLVDEKPLNERSPGLFPAQVNPTINPKMMGEFPRDQEDRKESDRIYKLTKLSKKIPKLSWRKYR